MLKQCWKNLLVQTVQTAKTVCVLVVHNSWVWRKSCWISASILTHFIAPLQTKAGSRLFIYKEISCYMYILYVAREVACRDCSIRHFTSGWLVKLLIGFCSATIVILFSHEYATSRLAARQHCWCYRSKVYEKS